MYKAVIYNPTTLKIHKGYKTMAAAKGAATRLGITDGIVDFERLIDGRPVSQLKIATIDEYNKLNTEVTVYSMMNGAPVVIRKSQVGGPCDPSTDRYWSM